MTSTSRSIRGVVGTLVAVSLFAAPGITFAQSAAVMTKQVLPIGGNACTPLFVSEVTPYIYEGELQSFDVVLSDRSYVAVFGLAGDVEIPFNFMSRRAEGNSALRLHVDTTVAVPTAIPVVLTLLSSGATSSAVCLSTVAFTVSADGTVSAEVPTTIPVADGSGSNGSGSGTTGSTSGTGGAAAGGKAGGKNGGSVQGSTTTATGTTSATSTSIGEVIGKMCTKNGAYQLWFILLAIFFVIAAFVGLSQPPLTERHGALPALLIGVPFAILMLLWYFVPDCRLSWLIPLILVIAGAIGLYSAYRTSSIMRPTIELPASSTKPEEKKTEGGTPDAK